jgi:hypothetical protein
VLGYEVSFQSGGKKHAWRATAEGALVEHSAPVALADVPEAVLAALNEAARGGKIESVQRRETHAMIRFVPCPEQRLAWIARWTKDGKAETARLDPDGRTLPVAK